MELTKENKMSNAPMTKLILSMSLPAMFSMLVQALYNVVDSVFVSHYSQDALTALSLIHISYHYFIQKNYPLYNTH